MRLGAVQNNRCLNSSSAIEAPWQREIARSVLIAAGSWLFMPWLPGMPSRQSAVGSMVRFGGDVTASNLAWLVCSGMDQVRRHADLWPFAKIFLDRFA
jgi:hypothetical protein